eukprot:TRINITY_DN22014_c0_g1_i1.p1 TRINITY_DN22014_c0_g1~~TRINITY_DN22014_c0_g1_i1.p1  ORF type:complete len:349 (+),score=99.62 TRINITY_DN22014_c0_g1_i1:80-1048(+)
MAPRGEPRLVPLPATGQRRLARGTLLCGCAALALLLLRLRRGAARPSLELGVAVAALHAARSLERLWGSARLAAYGAAALLLGAALRRLTASSPLAVAGWALLFRYATDVPHISPDPALPQLLPSNKAVPYLAAAAALLPARLGGGGRAALRGAAAGAVVSCLCSSQHTLNLLAALGRSPLPGRLRQHAAAAGALCRGALGSGRPVREEDVQRDYRELLAELAGQQRAAAPASVFEERLIQPAGSGGGARRRRRAAQPAPAAAAEAAPPPAAPRRGAGARVDPAAVAELAAMGFPAEEAELALRNNGGDIAAAALLLSSGTQ